MPQFSFYKGRRVFVTGHTGFKGSWLCRMLILAGAEVTGYSVGMPTEPALFELSGIEKDMTSVTGDIADLGALWTAFEKAQPEIVIHMAAQPLVRESYADPVYTYRTNVMGTVNILECVRRSAGVRSVVNVTTDKVYKSREYGRGFTEEDILDGFDPYSNSKSCSELVTASYRRSFFGGEDAPAISTVRAGNVIGGGDFSKDRIIPDCVRAASRGEPIILRNPRSVRPFQHVLEPISVYLMLAAAQFEDPSLAGSYNVGPDEEGCCDVDTLTDMFIRHWGEGASKLVRSDGGPHEAGYLKLDCSKLKSVFGWQPVWSLDKAVEKTVQWSRCMLEGGDVTDMIDRQIYEFLELMENGTVEQ